MLNFTAADRVGVVGGYIGGIASLLGGLSGLAAPAAASSSSSSGDGTPVNRYEMGMALDLAKKDGEIATLKSEKYTDEKLVQVYAEMERRVNALGEKVQANKDEQYQINLSQATYNGANNATIACMQNQIAQLMGLTKLVVPNGSVCPGWGAVKVELDTGTTTTTPTA